VDVSGNKTRPTGEAVEAFLASVPDPDRRADCREVARLMEEVVGEPPAIWGASMVGFGTYHYRYDSGREGDWFLAGFSPRKNDLTLYITAGFDQWPGLMGRLGKYRTGKSCLYLKRLSDVDLDALEELIRESVAHMRERHG
jgi:hypothetical protein